MNILSLLNEKQLNKVKYLDIKKGQILFKEDEVCKYIVVVVSGSFSISSFSYSGKEIIYNKINKDEVFGNNLLFSLEPRYRGDVITDIDSRIALIDKKTLLSFFHENEVFLEKYLTLTSEFSKRLNAKIKLLSLDTAEEKLFYYLYMHNGNIKYTSITTLAKELNMERETLSRLISKLEKSKKISKKNHSIRVIE